MNTLTKSARRRWWWGLWILLAVSAIVITAISVPPYLIPEPDTVPSEPDEFASPFPVVLHAVPGGLALLIGPFQFVPVLRARYPKAHRIAGRVYVASVVAGSVTAAIAATVSENGFAEQVAYYLMTAAWLYTIIQAYRTIRRGDVRSHRIWMIRNYALTFAAVTLRVYFGAGILLQQSAPSLTFDEIVVVSVWGSFLVNALVAEYFIINRTLMPPGRRKRRSKAVAEGKTEGHEGSVGAVPPSGSA